MPRSSFPSYRTRVRHSSPSSCTARGPTSGFFSFAAKMIRETARRSSSHVYPATPHFGEDRDDAVFRVQSDGDDTETEDDPVALGPHLETEVAHTLDADSE